MKTKLLVLVLALQSAWLLGTAFTQERILRVGQLILLETQPVDPRDLLRGDYVRLNDAVLGRQIKIERRVLGIG